MHLSFCSPPSGTSRNKRVLYRKGQLIFLLPLQKAECPFRETISCRFAGAKHSSLARDALVSALGHSSRRILPLKTKQISPSDTARKPTTSWYLYRNGKPFSSDLHQLQSFKAGLWPRIKTCTRPKRTARNGNPSFYPANTYRRAAISPEAYPRRNPPPCRLSDGTKPGKPSGRCW